VQKTLTAPRWSPSVNGDRLGNRSAGAGQRAGVGTEPVRWAEWTGADGNGPVPSQHRGDVGPSAVDGPTSLTCAFTVWCRFRPGVP